MKNENFADSRIEKALKESNESFRVIFPASIIFGGSVGALLGYFGYKEFGRDLPLYSEAVKEVIFIGPSIISGLFAGFFTGAKVFRRIDKNLEKKYVDYGIYMQQIRNNIKNNSMKNKNLFRHL